MSTSDVRQLGLWSSRLVIGWVVLFAMFLVIGLFGIPTLQLSFLVCLLLAPSFVVMMTAIHYLAPPEKKIWSQLGVSFSIIYAVFVTLTYFVQLTAVRNGSGESLLPFTYTPGSVFFAIDMLGYAFMCLSTWFAAPVFTGRDSLSMWTRRLFILHGVFAISSLIAPAFMPAPSPQAADSPAGALVMLFWSAIFVPLTFLASKHFERLEPAEGMRDARSGRMAAGN